MRDIDFDSIDWEAFRKENAEEIESINKTLEELQKNKRLQRAIKKSKKRKFLELTKKSKNINFDKNALVMPTKHVLRTLRHIYKNGYSNPSSTYLDGQRASELVERARLKVSDALGCLPSEIFFTGGASESIAWVAKNYRILADQRSHHAVLDAAEQSKNNDKAVFAFPWIVSETGECLAEEYEKKIKNKDTVMFADLTQAIGKEKIYLSQYPGIKFACASGQKIGGISGAGILYIKKKYQDTIKPLIYGSQEDGFRGGTTNLPAIVCFAEAIEEATKDIDKNQNKIRKVTNYIYTKIKTGDVIPVDDTPLFIYESIPVNVRMDEPYTNVINITFNHLTATAAVQIFDKLGFNISAGSACNSESERPSEAYLASGYTEDEAMRTIRISVGKNNTIREAKKFIKALKKIVALYDEED